MSGFFKKYKSRIVYVSAIVFSAAFIFLCNKAAGYRHVTSGSDIKDYTAEVLKITDVETSNHSLGTSDYDYFSMKITFNALITSGDMKDKTVSGTQTIDSTIEVSPREVKAGDRILIGQSPDADGNPEWTFMEYHRSNILIILCAVFFILLLLFGRKKGFNTIVSLVFTCMAIFLCFVPAVLSGKNIYAFSIVICLFVIIMTLLIVSGANKKSFVAALGCVGGLTVTGVLTVIMDNILHLTGMVDDQSMYLLMLENPVDLKGVIFGSIIIGALGASMDVSMSIASSLREISDNADNPTLKQLMKSGLNIGRDIMGTMANTLILAYIGCELSSVLLIVAGNPSMLTLFNLEMIVAQVLQSIVGSFGILFTIPITSALAAYFYTNSFFLKKQI